MPIDIAGSGFLICSGNSGNTRKPNTGDRSQPSGKQGTIITLKDVMEVSKKTLGNMWTIAIKSSP